jgi:hypothetical protein
MPFSFNNGNGTASEFTVKSNGSLEPVTTLSGLQVTTAGLAAWQPPQRVMPDTSRSAP